MPKIDSLTDIMANSASIADVVSGAFSASDTIARKFSAFAIPATTYDAEVNHCPAIQQWVVCTP